MVYMISYDLADKKASAYENLFDAIKSFNDYIQVLESQWFISTNQTAESIYKKLSPYLKDNDGVFINEISGDHCGWIKLESVAWLKSHGV